MESADIPTMTSIHLAAFNGHTQVLQRPLATDERNIYSEDSTGSASLMWASLNGNHRSVQPVLSYGADVNNQNRSCSNALHAAYSDWDLANITFNKNNINNDTPARHPKHHIANKKNKKKKKKKRFRARDTIMKSKVRQNFSKTLKIT